MVLGLPDPHPDPLVIGTDQRIWIRIRTRTIMLRIRNNVCLNNKSSCKLPATARLQQSRYTSCQVAGRDISASRRSSNGRDARSSGYASKSREARKQGRQQQQECQQGGKEHFQVQGHQQQHTRQSLSSNCEGCQRKQGHQQEQPGRQKQPSHSNNDSSNIEGANNNNDEGICKDFSRGGKELLHQRQGRCSSSTLPLLQPQKLVR